MRTLLACLVLFSTLANAQLEQVINFNGQNSETISIDKDVNVVRPQEFEVPDTCNRQIPYQVHECNNVTRYRQQCSTIPSSQRCWDEPERVCRTVTRHRQECHTGPSRQECRDNPSRQVCTERPSRQVCTERPTREVCRTNSQGQQTCQTVGGGQSCQTVGGGQSCQTVGGGQSCHTVPGQQVCRDVAYNDQDCNTVSRRRCETVPAHQACTDIPYYEEVCGNVTRYRNEPYACTRTETRDITTVKKLKGNFNISFITNGVVEEFPLNVVIAPESATHEKFTVKTTLGKEPKVFVSAQKRRIKVASETDKEIVLEGDMTIETLDPASFNVSFPEWFKNNTISEASLVTLEIDGSISATGKVELELIHTPLVGKDKMLAEIKAEYPSDKVKIEGNKLLIDLAGLVSKLEKRMVINVKLTTEPSLRGEILNAVKPELTKQYKKLKITKQ